MRTLLYSKNMGNNNWSRRKFKTPGPGQYNIKRRAGTKKDKYSMRKKTLNICTFINTSF